MKWSFKTFKQIPCMGREIVTKKEIIIVILLITFFLGPISLFPAIGEYQFNKENYGLNYDADIEGVRFLLLDDMVPLIYGDHGYDTTYSMSDDDLVIMGEEDVNASTRNYDSDFVSYKLEFNDEYTAIENTQRIPLQIPLSLNIRDMIGFVEYKGNYFTLQVQRANEPGKSIHRALIEYNEIGEVLRNISIPISYVDENDWAEFQFTVHDDLFFLSAYYYSPNTQKSECTLEIYRDNSSNFEYLESKKSPINSCPFALQVGPQNYIWERQSSDIQTVSSILYGYIVTSDPTMEVVASIFYQPGHENFISSSLLEIIDLSPIEEYNPSSSSYSLSVGSDLVISELDRFAVLSPIKLHAQFVLPDSNKIGWLDYLVGVRIMPVDRNYEVIENLILKSVFTSIFIGLGSYLLLTKLRSRK